MVKTLLTLLSLLASIPGSISGQVPTVNPPSPSVGLFAPRGSLTSPDGRYEWIVNEASPVSYQLIDSIDHTVRLTINCYFAESDKRTAIRYARALRVYWNRDSNIVAIDELNYRRAGYLYFVSVKDGNAKQIDVNIPAPRDFEESRFCASKGWVSPSKFSVRQAVKLKGGAYQSKYYIIDFGNEDHPTATIAE